MNSAMFAGVAYVQKRASKDGIDYAITVWQDECRIEVTAGRNVGSVYKRRGQYVINLWSFGGTPDEARRQAAAILELASIADLLNSGTVPPIVLEVIQQFPTNSVRSSD